MLTFEKQITSLLSNYWGENFANKIYRIAYEISPNCCKKNTLFPLIFRTHANTPNKTLLFDFPAVYYRCMYIKKNIISEFAAYAEKRIQTSVVSSMDLSAGKQKG